MRFASVCSGIESASVAFAPLGWHAAWFAETDKACSAFLRKQFPGTPNHGDLTTLAARVRSGEVEPQPLLTGGTPCQDFSIAGLRRGLAGARGALTLAYVDLLDAFDEMLLDPAVAVWENVPGVLNHKNNPFGNFLAALVGEDVPLIPSGKRWTDAGLVSGPKRTAAWRCLDAQYFGLAQRRKRVFVVASARHDFDPGEVLLEFEGVRRDTPPSRETREDVAGILDARTTGGGFPGTDGACKYHAVPVSPTLRAGANRTGGDRPPGTDVDTADSLIVEAFGGGNCAGPIAAAAALNANERYDFDSETFVVQGFNGRMDPRTYGDLTGTLDTDSLTQCVAFDTTQVTSVVNRSNPQPGGPCHPLAVGAHPPAIAYSIARDALDRSGEASDGSAANRSGLGIDEEIAATIKGRGPGAVAYGFQVSQSGARVQKVAGTLDSNYGSRRHNGVLTTRVRRLLPVECERLQGFPDGWTEGQADGPRYKQLGNSKAVPVVRWLGERIKRQLDNAL